MADELTRRTGDSTDWRLQFGDRPEMYRATLYRRRFTKLRDTWDHEHCVFCAAKFLEPDHPFASESTFSEGYVIPDGYRWICTECYEDFAEQFGWTVEYLDSENR